MSDRESKDALFAAFAEVAKALGSGRRTEIVDVLAQGDRSVDEIAGEIDQSVANASHHLQALARAGLISSRRDGTRVFYTLSSDRVGELWAALLNVRATLDEAVRLYEEGLRLYAECAKRLDAADLRITQLADALAKQARERGAG